MEARAKVKGVSGIRVAEDPVSVFTCLMRFYLFSIPKESPHTRLRGRGIIKFLHRADPSPNMFFPR